MKLLLVLLLFCMVGQAVAKPPYVLDGMIPIENGVCSVKGDVMSFDGVGTPCVLFLDEKKEGFLFFGVLKDGDWFQVFEWNLKTNKSRLIWKKGRHNV
jgi:hypothetical protein